MKKLFHIFIALVFSLLLSGCYSCYWNAGCSYPGRRCNEYQIYTPCGSYLKHPCESICSMCKFKEPECALCWQCLNKNDCAVASQFQYCCAGTRYTM